MRERNEKSQRVSVEKVCISDLSRLIAWSLGWVLTFRIGYIFRSGQRDTGSAVQRCGATSGNRWRVPRVGGRLVFVCYVGIGLRWDIGYITEELLGAGVLGERGRGVLG